MAGERRKRELSALAPVPLVLGVSPTPVPCLLQPCPGRAPGCECQVCCRARPPGHLVASWFCAHGIQWQPWTRAPAVDHLALGAGDLYPVGFQRSARPQMPPHPPSPPSPCSLFPPGVKQLHGGLAEPQGADGLGSGHCCVLPSLNRACEIQDTSQPPSPHPCRSQLLSKRVQPSLWAAQASVMWKGIWGVSVLLAASPHLRSHPSFSSLPLPPPSLPLPLPAPPSSIFPPLPPPSLPLSLLSLPSCSLQNQWAVTPVCSAGRSPPVP